jgi:hypothetical protein
LIPRWWLLTGRTGRSGSISTSDGGEEASASGLVMLGIALAPAGAVPFGVVGDRALQRRVRRC